jgi:hypothetical protein
MVLIVINGSLYAICETVEQAEKRFGTIWGMETDILPSGQITHTMKIGV